MLNIYYARSNNVIENTQLDESYRYEINSFMVRLDTDDNHLPGKCRLYYHKGEYYKENLFEKSQIIFVGVPNKDENGNRLIGKGLYSQIKSAYKRDIPIYYLIRINGILYIDEIDFKEDIYDIDELDWTQYARISVYSDNHLKDDPKKFLCDLGHRKKILERIGYKDYKTTIDPVTRELQFAQVYGNIASLRPERQPMSDFIINNPKQEGRKSAIFTPNSNNSELLLLLK